MAKSILMMEARKMRSQGASVRVIAQKTNVAKSTASLWVRDIVLSVEQLEKLKQQSINGAERGRLIGALKQKQARLNRIEEGKTSGTKHLGTLTVKEFFVAGLALYWAEGNKRMKKIEFCNSDPKMITFFLAWFQKFFDLKLSNFKCYIGINILHKNREQDIKKYWIKTTGLLSSQFTKTSFKYATTQKTYENFNEHFGTLSVRILKPARILYKIAGLVEALRSTPLSG